MPSSWGTGTTSRRDRGAWAISTLSAKVLAKFGKLPGVRRVSPGHYSVTGPFAKISPFVCYEFQLVSDAFAGTGTKTFTVTMTLDSGGRPVKITATGRSASNVFTAAETFGYYNKPVTITDP